MNPDANRKVSRLLLTAAILVCAAEIFWFGSKCWNQIDYDGMAYTGIARHLIHGQFHAAVNAFRSPLLSWIIAAISFGATDLVRVGKFVNLGAFLLSLVLLYVFAKELWYSEIVASVAVLLLVLGRGLVVAAVEIVTPDFLFAALTLAYFIVLLRCLRHQGERKWFYLGAIHGVAYLAKGFALPWLALCSLVAVALSGGSRKRRASRLASAALIPVLVAASWATVLHAKYGVFTTGTQFKSNLLQWTLHAYRVRHDATYLLLMDTTKEVDEYLVDDPMPPGSWPWMYRVNPKNALPNILQAERRNVPSVLKEIIIVATPGGCIAFLVTLVVLTRRRNLYPVEFRLAAVITTGAASLVLAYSMLVFDARYLFPLVPLLIAIGARFLVSDAQLDHNGWRRISVALVVLGVIASLVYPSSPFRRITQDFQVVCYDAGRSLKGHSGSTVVSIGSGPFPEHGVGWEAGYKAAYFGGWRIVGAIESLPSATEWDSLGKDVEKVSPDAILVWGRPADANYSGLVRNLVSQYPGNPVKTIADPILGEVGVVVFVARSGVGGVAHSIASP